MFTVDLSSFTAVVTGGSSGIGLATASRFLAAGASVAICGRDAARLRDAEADLRSRHDGARLLAATCDVLDAEQVRRILAGEPLEEHTPRSVVSATDDGSKRPVKERPSMVPPLPPLNKPLPQE